MPKNPTKKQAGLLLSKNSPLSPSQKSKFKAELKSGAVKIRKGK